MKKLFVGMLIGLGLVAGFGFTNEVSACENNSSGEYTCALCEEQYCMEENCDVTCECGIEVFELEVDYIAEHKENDECTDNHFLCENCGAFFCLTEDCYCGEYVVNERYIYEEIFANEMIMSPYELACFEEMIWDMFLEDYCVNYCEECDCYYYEICDCEYACAECNEPVECDFAIFVCDNYDYIMSIADDFLEEIQEIIEDMNQQVLVIYEF